MYFNQKYFDALEFVAKHQIKVVYSTRNPLDVIISRSKYLNHSLTESHCRGGQLECVERHQSAKATISKHNIIQQLTDLIQQSDQVIGLLEKYKVNYFNTTYEELNFGSNEERLSSMQRLADFVTPGRKVTLEEVAANLHVPLLFTSRAHHIDEVTNYDVLVRTLNSELNGTYAKYLH